MLCTLLYSLFYKTCRSVNVYFIRKYTSSRSISGLGFSDVISIENVIIKVVLRGTAAEASVVILMRLVVLQDSHSQVFRFADPAFQEGLAFVSVEMLFLI